MEEFVDTQGLEAQDVSAAWEDERPLCEAQSPAPQADSQPEEERFTLKHLGQEQSVSRQELLTLAQKGMDYDRIRGKLDAARSAPPDEGLVDAGEAAENHEPPPGERARQAQDDRRNGFLEFFRSRPDVTAEDIPASVFKAVQAGQSLTAAYSVYENALLRSEISALKKGEENRLRAAGSAASQGRGGQGSVLDELWYDGR